MGGTSPAVAGRALTRRQAPPRVLKTTVREGHAPDLIQRLADVSLTQSVDGSARSFFDPVQLVDADVDADVYDDVYADVGDDVDHDVMMTSSLTRSSIRTGQRPTRILTRPGQRSKTRPGY